MNFARRARQQTDINLTPLIDVVFLLLIFFMVSTTFIRETHLFIDLPEASAQPGREEGDWVEISITRAGDYAVNDVALADRGAATLRNAIDQVSGGDNSRRLAVTADSATPHQSVVTALDVAGQLGFRQISISTRIPGRQD